LRQCQIEWLPIDRRRVDRLRRPLRPHQTAKLRPSVPDRSDGGVVLRIDCAIRYPTRWQAPAYVSSARRAAGEIELGADVTVLKEAIGAHPQMPWKPRAPTDLQRQLDAAQLKLLKANAELEHKTQCVSRLEILVAERNACIDALHGRIDALREQNKRLDQEADRLAEMVRLAPQLDAAMLSPK